MTTWITICDTCKNENWDPKKEPQPDGERLAELIEAKAAGFSNLATRRMSCLMGCARACNVTVQGENKLNYTLGSFEATAEAAAGIVDYARAHAESENGRVPFREWPPEVKGHFVTRHPPLPSAE